jgi:hypothetical protein
MSKPKYIWTTQRWYSTELKIIRFILRIIKLPFDLIGIVSHYLLHAWDYLDDKYDEFVSWVCRGYVRVTKMPKNGRKIFK